MGDSALALKQAAALKRMEHWALFCLLCAAAVFVGSMFMPAGVGARMVKAVGEAALVGGLADWFAVSALFRRPLGFPVHTAIIPNSKDKIADNLATFVKEKFFNPTALSDLVVQHDPAQKLTAWLQAPETTRMLGQQAGQLVGGALRMVGDRPVQAFIQEAMHTLVDKVDVAPALGSVLETLTLNNRHQALLDTALLKLQDELKNPAIQEKIAERVMNWLKTEHYYKQLLLPTGSISNAVAEGIVTNVRLYLSEMASKPTHELRQEFDTKLKSFIEALKHDPALHEKGEALKAYIKHNPAFNAYAKSLWASLRDWVEQDLKQDGSQLQQHIDGMGQWLAKSLADSEQLRASLNQHIRSFAAAVGPGMAEHLTQHISRTIRNWDAQDMSREIERSIGADLQFIRINGTVVGGLIGLGLFFVFELGSGRLTG